MTNASRPNHTRPITEYATPSLLRRFAAMLYDSLLLMALSVLYGALTVAFNLLINGAPASGEKIAWGNWGIVVFLGWVLTLAGFFCYFWCKSGQTLGMKTWRIKMFDAQALQLPSLSQALQRCLLAPLSLLVLGLGYWFIYTNTERQTLHDKLSNTRILLLSKKPDA